MKTEIVRASTIALTLIIPAIAQQAIAGSFKNESIQCYFFKGEKLAIEDTCQASGTSWAGGGGYSLKWSDGVTTQIKFGLQGRGIPVCPSQDQMAVDDTCGQKYSRSIKTLKSIDSRDGAMTCIQLNQKSVCWKFKSP
jgi:hypothetical protein